MVLIDHKKKKNCKGNPWCCFGLGEFKEGIWSPRPSIFNRLGTDLSLQMRKPLSSSPSTSTDTVLNTHYGGLRNLGATCYMNVTLQVSSIISAMFSSRFYLLQSFY